MSDDKSNRTTWLPVPGVAVPVRVTLDGQSELDGLARTILRLLQARERTPGELARKLGMEEHRDLVIEALRELEDRYLIAPVEENSDVYELIADEVHDLQGAEIRSAWAFILPGPTPTVLPRLWFGDKLPSGRSDAKCRGRDLSEIHKTYYEAWRWNENLKDKNLSTLLQGLVRRNDLALCSGETDGTGDEAGSLPLPELSSGTVGVGKVLRSIEIDHVGRQNARHDFEWTPLWVQVDLLPRIARAATVVYHQPDIQPKKFITRPINPGFEDWFDSDEHLRPLRDHVEGLAEAMKVEFSLVLKTAGIESAAELEVAVDDHRRELESRTGLTAPSSDEALLKRRLPDKIRDAWRWLHISRQCPEQYVQTARDSYAHAVEALAQALRDHALEYLKKWKKRWEALESKGSRKEFEKSRKKAGWRADRLGMVGIEPTELGPSLNFLKNSLKRIHNLPSAIDKADEQGAGSSISLWLLPIFLLDDGPAKDYAQPIRYALDHERFILGYINELIDVRNDVFHDRSEDLPLLEQVDRKLFSVWGALETGYREATRPGEADRPHR